MVNFGTYGGPRLRLAGEPRTRTKPVSAQRELISGERGTESGTVEPEKQPSDPDLALIQDRWPKLPEHVRTAILALVDARPG